MSRPARPRLRGFLAGLLVLLLAAGAGALVLGHDQVPPPDPVEEPAAVPPPEGLRLPEVPPAAPVAAGLSRSGSTIDPRAVRRAVGRLLDDRRLGRRVALTVAGVDGRPVHHQGPRSVTPASMMKLLTALAALASLGPEHRFVTRVVGSGSRLTLVGGGDPLLARRPPNVVAVPAQADLGTLARRTALALERGGRRRVRLEYDDSLFAGPSVNPRWEDGYVPDDVVSPITALWVDQGRSAPGLLDRSEDPSGDAADAFAAALQRRGIRVLGRPREAPAPRSASEVAAVEGAELVEVVHHVLELSDNEAAEVLARHVAIAEGRPATFRGAAAAVAAVLKSLGVDLGSAVVLDGSGLARGNRLDTRTLLEVLATAAAPENPGLAGLVEGLPVAGFNGSLALRFGTRADSGLGWVRAKTGTLTGVHGLAGLVTTRDGGLLTFVAVADRVRVRNTLYARDRLDQIAASLARCRCVGSSS